MVLSCENAECVCTVVRAAHLTKIGGPFMNSFLRSSQNSSGDSCLLLIAFMRRVVSCILVYRSTQRRDHRH